MADYDLDPEAGGGLLGGSGGGWLGNLLNFSGGRSTTADLYGDLFSKKQLAAIQQRESQAKFKGLLDVLAQAAAPSEFKKNYGQILGQVGGAMLGAEGGDKAATTALGGQLTAQKIAQLKQELALDQQYQQIMRDIMAKRAAAGGGMPGAAPVPPPGAPPGSPPPGPTPDAPPPNPAGNGPPPSMGTFGLPGSAPRPSPGWGLPQPGARAPSGGDLGRDTDSDSPTYGQYVIPPGGSASDPGAGAGMPPVDPASQYAMMMGGGLLGAGGGGAPPPFSPEEGGLPPQDTVIPSGLGGLLNPDAIMLAGFSGGGKAEDDAWLNRNAPFPTRADPVGEPIKWRHDTPVIDPSDPASQGPGSPFGRGPGQRTEPSAYEAVMARARVPAQTSMARTGGSGGGSGPAPTPLPSAPAAGSDQPIPGIGLSPQDLGLLDAFATMAKRGSPFKSLLDTYYKDPAYLGQAAGAESRARKDVELEMDPLIRRQTELAALRAKLELQPKIDAAIEWAKNDPKLSFEEKKAEIDRLTEERKQVLSSNLDLTMIKVPDGQGGQIEVQGTRSQAVRAANGLAVPELGIPARRTDSPTAPTGAPIAPPIGTPVLSEPEKKISGAITEEFIEMRKTARLAAPTIRSTHDLRAKLDSGMFTGLDADWSLFGAKLGDALGLAGKNDQEKIANTEVYISKLGEETANLIKSMKLGPPTSDADVKFAERIAGRQNLSAAAIRELLEMREKYARLAIQQYNDEAQGYGPRAFGGGRQLIPMPEPYVQKQGTSPGGQRWRER